MYKGNVTVFAKISLLVVTVILVGILAVSLFLNISHSVKLLKTIGFLHKELDSGFTNVNYQMQLDENNLFVIEADKAKQITENLVFFDNIKARTVVGDVDFSAKADTGNFDEIIKLFILNNNVTINYFANLSKSEEVRINVVKQEVLFPVRVNISSEGYNFTADFLKYDVANKQLIEARNSDYLDILTKDRVQAELVLGDKSDANLLTASNARLTNDDMILTGKNFLIRLIDNKQIENINASGDIKMVNPKYKITSEKLFYDPKLATIKFMHDVILLTDGGEVRGEQLVYDMKADMARFVNDGDKRIKVKINKLQ
ncbi:MAG: hypothetical protein HON23_03170 [Rickettsiales bacterium]|nr:hypothetical protein [Rickettsiales bacterium]